VTRLSGSLTWSRAGEQSQSAAQPDRLAPRRPEMVEKKLDKGDRRQDRYLGCEVAGEIVAQFLELRCDAGELLSDEGVAIFSSLQARRASLQPEWLRGRKIGTACGNGFCTSGPPTAWSR